MGSPATQAAVKSNDSNDASSMNVSALLLLLPLFFRP